MMVLAVTRIGRNADGLGDGILSFPPSSFSTFLGFIPIIPAENRLSLYDDIIKDGQR